MKVLNIHGYHGTPHNAAYGALISNGFDDVITPEIDYDAKTPETVLDELCNIVTENKIGLLINPCLMPFLHLPELGYNDEITPFIPMFGTLDKLDINKVSCIVGDDDEIISTHAFTEKLLKNPRFRRIPGGHHSGATLPLVDYFAEVLPKR